MANQNITQLATQSGSADTSSLLYAVTGGNTDTSLPLTVLFRNPSFTGTPTVPSAVIGTNTTQIASTAFVQSQLASTLSSYAPLNSPVFTGTPTVPGYLTTTSAASTYLTQTNAASTYAPLAGASFTGDIHIIKALPQIFLNDTSATSPGYITWMNNGSTVWTLHSAGGADGAFLLDRWVGGAFVDNPLSVDNTTGQITVLETFNAPAGILAGGTTFSSDTGIKTSASEAHLFIDAPVTSNASVRWFTGGSKRFELFRTSDPETGSNAGSNIIWNAFADDGSTFIGNILTVQRATQQVTFDQKVILNTTQGIAGTTAADNAVAGSIGEYLSSTASGVSLTSATPTNLTSLSLTAGDWDIEATVQWVPNAATTITTESCSVSTTSATHGPFGQFAVSVSTLGVGLGDTLVTPTVRVNVSSTTTVYCVCTGVFTGGTCAGNGFIRARRVR